MKPVATPERQRVRKCWQRPTTGQERVRHQVYTGLQRLRVANRCVAVEGTVGFIYRERQKREWCWWDCVAAVEIGPTYHPFRAGSNPVRDDVRGSVRNRGFAWWNISALLNVQEHPAIITDLSSSLSVSLYFLASSADRVLMLQLQWRLATSP